MSTPVIFSFSGAGAETAARIAAIVGGEVVGCGPGGEDARMLLPETFGTGRTIIGVCAAGILIRLLAPHLTDKHGEPPVIAVSADGRSVVPLLGGHHGANRLSREIAEALGGHAAVTTASDGRFARGLDEPSDGWVLENPEAAKAAMAAVLRGASLRLEGAAPWLLEAGYPIAADGTVSVAVSERMGVVADLVYRPKTLLAGVGCERGTPAGDIVALVERVLAEAGLSPLSLAALGTVEIKADEAGLLAAAAHFAVPLRLWSAEELGRERHRLLNPSAVVEVEIGIPGVAEAVALKAGALVVPKQKGARATCAIGQATAPLDVDALGLPPGQLHIVGIGPGERESRTASATAALRETTDWVGYDLYLDLVSDLRTEQAEHRFPLGGEEDRVRHALELAGTGKQVALVCSGDGQIYAMAALVYELLEAEGARAPSAAARRVAVQSHPGISAFQAASARLGALIGHDFCAISLSDLLTPRDDIIKRLHGAAQADFVTAFYNPRSRRRTDLLDEAKAIFLRHRPADTPVIVASNVGRPEERLEVTTLEDFAPERVDMLTIVLFGSSASRAFRRGDGRTVAYTPRGYERKGEPKQ